jgi:hypothetical protein
MDTSNDRAWAIRALRETLAQLEDHRRRHPDTGELVPRIHADTLNDALEVLRSELPPEMVAHYRIKPQQIFPPSKNQGRPVEAVRRDSIIRSALGILDLIVAE